MTPNIKMGPIYLFGTFCGIVAFVHYVMMHEYVWALFMLLCSAINLNSALKSYDWTNKEN